MPPCLMRHLTDWRDRPWELSPLLLLDMTVLVEALACTTVRHERAPPGALSLRVVRRRRRLGVVSVRSVVEGATAAGDVAGSACAAAVAAAVLPVCLFSVCDCIVIFVNLHHPEIQGEQTTKVEGNRFLHQAGQDRRGWVEGLSIAVSWGSSISNAGGMTPPTTRTQEVKQIPKRGSVTSNVEN